MIGKVCDVSTPLTIKNLKTVSATVIVVPCHKLWRFFDVHLACVISYEAKRRKFGCVEYLAAARYAIDVQRQVLNDFELLIELKDSWNQDIWTVILGLQPEGRLLSSEFLWLLLTNLTNSSGLVSLNANLVLIVSCWQMKYQSCQERWTINRVHVRLWRKNWRYVKKLLRRLRKWKKSWRTLKSCWRVSERRRRPEKKDGPVQSQKRWNWIRSFQTLIRSTSNVSYVWTLRLIKKVELKNWLVSWFLSLLVFLLKRSNSRVMTTRTVSERTWSGLDLQGVCLGWRGWFVFWRYRWRKFVG